MNFKCLISLLLLAMLATQAAGSAPHYDNAGDLPPVQDTALRQQLAREVCDAGYCELVATDQLAVALVVMPTGQPARLAMINGHNMMYAASLPKVAILLGAMVSSQRGELELTPAAMEDLDRMIRVSCNDCATRILALVGRDKLLQILQEPQFDFYDAERAGGLWVGKDYASSNAYKRDPIKGLSHAATPYQVARLYYRLNNGDLLDEKHGRIMKDMLDEPGIDHKFVRGLSAEDAHIEMRKSGGWESYHADSVLVSHPEGKYIAIALVQDDEGNSILESLADLLDRLARGRASP